MLGFVLKWMYGPCSENSNRFLATLRNYWPIIDNQGLRNITFDLRNQQGISNFYYVVEAIILKKMATREWDQLVVCYTQDFGKQTYIAKSLSRPTSKQASHLDVLNLVDFELVQKNAVSARSLGGGGGMPIITSAYSLENFARLKQSLPALAVASYILEVFDKFVFDNDPDEKLWEFLNSKLAFFNEQAIRGDYDWRKTLNDTQNETLVVLGFDHNIDLESITGHRFDSLVFANKILYADTPVIRRNCQVN